MVNEELEARLAALTTDAAPEERRAILEVYADWVEERGRPDMAHALRAFQPDGFRPVNLAVVESTAEEPPPWTRSRENFPDVTLPLELFVIDELIPREDKRPVEDRKDLRITGETFDKHVAEAEISLALDLDAEGLGDGEVEVRINRLGDFEPDAVATQLSKLGVAADNLEGALRALFAKEQLRTVERTWRSLRWLLDRVRAPVRVAIVNATAEELIADFDDCPKLHQSGFFRIVNNHNHPGMRPSGAVVFGSQLRREPRGFRLVRTMAEVARRKSLPLIAGTELELSSRWDWLAHTAPVGRHAIIATPSFVLRPAHPFESARLEGSASYLVAARMAEAFCQHWGGGGLGGVLRGVELTRQGGRNHSILAASRGFTELYARDGDVHLSDGATASPSPTGSRSLDLHVIACRLGLQLQNYHFRQLWRSNNPELLNPTRLAERLEAGLRRRLVNAHGFQVSLVDARYEEEPRSQFEGALEVGLSLELPATTGSGVVRHVERMTVRLEF
ncbi:MAG: type VI secretion system contractile sheath large subunit [Polyangiaceae bacterium]